MITSKNFFLQDTRMIESTSAFSLLYMCIAAYLSHGTILPHQLWELHYWQFWTLLSGFFGLTQLFIAALDKNYIARSLLAWVTGTYWVWSGLIQFTPEAAIACGISVILGIMCFYTFIVNLLIGTRHGIFST